MVNLTDEQKKDYLNGTFYYETTELFNGLQFLRYNNKLLKNNEIDTAVFTINNNIAIEHILLHSRAFDEFFYKGISKQNKGIQQKDNLNVRAVDYISDWKGIRKPKSIVMLEKWTNIQIHHMDWRRLIVEYKDKEWDLTTLVKDLLIIIDSFLDKIDKKYHGDNTKALKSKLNRYIAITIKEELIFKSVKTGTSVTFV